MCPVVLTRGGDQQPVSTKFEMREDDNVIRNYGRMLVELAAAIPDGIVCFFVSYSYMDKIVSKWHDMGILQACAARMLLKNEDPEAFHLGCTSTCLTLGLCLGCALWAFDAPPSPNAFGGA